MDKIVFMSCYYESLYLLLVCMLTKLSRSENENNFYQYLTCYYNKYNKIDNETDSRVIQERDEFVSNAVNSSLRNK